MSHVFGRTFTFYKFGCNGGALNLPQYVVALPESATLSWPAKTTQKLNMSGLDFLALVLQSSNSFNLIAFFSWFLQFISSWLQGPSSIVAFRGHVCDGVVWSELEVYFIFFSSEIFKRFFRETPVRKVLHFLYFCL